MLANTFLTPLCKIRSKRNEKTLTNTLSSCTSTCVRHVFTALVRIRIPSYREYSEDAATLDTNRFLRFRFSSIAVYCVATISAYAFIYSC